MHRVTCVGPPASGRLFASTRLGDGLVVFAQAREFQRRPDNELRAVNEVAPPHPAGLLAKAKEPFQPMVAQPHGRLLLYSRIHAGPAWGETHPKNIAARGIDCGDHLLIFCSAQVTKWGRRRGPGAQQAMNGEHGSGRSTGPRDYPGHRFHEATEHLESSTAGRAAGCEGPGNSKISRAGGIRRERARRQGLVRLNSR